MFRKKKRYKIDNWFNEMVVNMSEKELFQKGWNNYMNWYFAPQIKFKLIPYLKNREFALMIPKNYPHPERSTRLMKVTNVQSLDFFYDVTGMKSKKTFYNFFCSVARYNNGIPSLPYDLDIRRKAKEVWNKEHWQSITGYDFFLDIDGKHEDFEMTKFSAIEVKKWFDENNIPHKLRFSGKGFHFLIPFEHMMPYIPDNWYSFDPNRHKNIYRLFGRVAAFISDNISEMVDKQIYDPRRVIKIPYSLAVYDLGFFVCLPINSNDELMKFHYKDASFDNFVYDQIRYHEERLYNKEGSCKPIFDTLTKYKYIKKG